MFCPGSINGIQSRRCTDSQPVQQAGKRQRKAGQGGMFPKPALVTRAISLPVKNNHKKRQPNGERTGAQHCEHVISFSKSVRTRLDAAKKSCQRTRRRADCGNSLLLTTLIPYHNSPSSHTSVGAGETQSLLHISSSRRGVPVQHKTGISPSQRNIPAHCHSGTGGKILRIPVFSVCCF